MTKWARMKYWLPTFLTVNFSLLISHCGLDIENPSPPDAPVWVAKSLLEEWPERGIDAQETGGIHLEWESSLDEEIVAYIIYRATYDDVSDSMGEYNILEKIEITSTPVGEHTDRSAYDYVKYYYKLKAEDTSENLSDFSESICYSLLPPIWLEYMIPNGQSSTLDSDRHLTWRYWNTMEMEDYCLTILTDSNEMVLREVIAPTNYISAAEFWQIPNDIVLVNGQLYQWRIDTSAKYVEDVETSGSESSWAVFTYID